LRIHDAEDVSSRLDERRRRLDAQDIRPVFLLRPKVARPGLLEYRVTVVSAEKKQRLLSL
jgi:hypothetical protein